MVSQFCVIPSGVDEIRSAPASLGDGHGVYHLVDVLTAIGPPGLTAVGTTNGIAHGFSLPVCHEAAALRAVIFART